MNPIISSLTEMDISGNVLICSCDMIWFTKRLRRVLLNENETLCSTTYATLEPLRGKPLTLFNPSELCGINMNIYCCAVLGTVTLVAFFVILYHNRWVIRYKFLLFQLAVHGNYEIMGAPDEDKYEYDINVMFTENDKEWATDNLQPAIRNRLPNFGRIAFDDHDLILGMHYLDAVYRNVEKSFKTILLLSRAAVKDNTFLVKFRIAMTYACDNHIQNLILVFLEDIPDGELPYLVRLYLSEDMTYLKWLKSETGQEYFWNELTKRIKVNFTG